MNPAHQTLEDRNPLPGVEKLGTRELHCSIHGPYEATGTKLSRSGREIWSHCQACTRELEAMREKARQEHEAAQKAERLEAMLKNSAIPARFMDRTLDNFKAANEGQRKALAQARNYLDNFQANYRQGLGMIFAGPPGTGKSHLATAILRGVMPEFFGSYTTCLGIIRAVRETWRKDSEQSEGQVLNELARVSLLVIDEVGVQYGTDGEQTILFDVLDRRYRDMRPTIVLTNQDAAGLKLFLGERVFDRLQENSTWVPFTWGSYRATARKELQ